VSSDENFASTKRGVGRGRRGGARGWGWRDKVKKRDKKEKSIDRIGGFAVRDHLFKRVPARDMKGDSEGDRITPYTRSVGQIAEAQSEKHLSDIGKVGRT